MFVDILEEFSISELSFNYPAPKLTILYAEEGDFLAALNLYNQSRFEEALKIFHKLSLEEPQNINYINGCACTYFSLKAYEKALECYNKAMNISNSYHCHFHYFGFNVSYNIALISKCLGDMESFEKYTNKARFFYNEGYKSATNTLQKTMKDCLPPFKDVCIFKESSLEQNIIKAEEFYIACQYEMALKEFYYILQINEEQHFKYHLHAAELHFNRGMCFKILGSSEIARVDFEKALKMESNNPNHDKIFQEMKKL
jgi:tetratricopeptide (TPR) repeat protein